MSPKKNGELELENTGRSKDIVKCHTERLKKKSEKYVREVK